MSRVKALFEVVRFTISNVATFEMLHIAVDSQVFCININQSRRKMS